MPAKQVRFGLIADQWLDRHQDVSSERIISLVLGSVGQLSRNKDGTVTFTTIIKIKNKYKKIHIKYREVNDKYVIYLIVIKIHCGKLPNNF
jgi:hypothetical protein